MEATARTLYDTDFVEWAEHTATLLRQGRFDELDLENMVEEIECLGRSERVDVKVQLRRMLRELVKQRVQPEEGAGASWIVSINDARAEIRPRFKHSPSLRRYAEDNLQEIYTSAVKDALFETNLTGRAKELKIPAECPYTLDDLLEGDLADPAAIRPEGA
jgi:hypothetical protein